MRTVDAFLDFCDLVHARDYHECWSMTWLDTLRRGQVAHVATGGAHGAGRHAGPGLGSGHAIHTRVFAGRIRVHRLDDLRRPRLALGRIRSRSASSISAARRRAMARFSGTCTSVIGRSPGTGFRSIAISTRRFLSNRLSGGCGVLADGPDRLLREYAAVLSESDLEPYFPYPPRPPHSWDDEKRPLGRRRPEPVGADPGRLVVHRGYRFLRQSPGIAARAQRTSWRSTDSKRFSTRPMPGRAGASRRGRRR